MVFLLFICERVLTYDTPGLVLRHVVVLFLACTVFGARSAQQGSVLRVVVWVGGGRLGGM